MKPNYSIVLGCPRSGTTFLMKCLNAIPNSECVSGHLVPILTPHLFGAQVLDKAMEEAFCASLKFSFKDYLESIEYARVPVIAKWLKQDISISELFQSLRGSRNIQSFIYKEPFFSFAPELVYRAFPEAKIIHIYRDGRDAADSLDRTFKVLTDEKLTTLETAETPLGCKFGHRFVPWWVEPGSESEFLSYTPYLRAVWMWREMVKRCHGFFSQPEVQKSGRVMLLKYEELVTNPEYYGSAVVNHLGAAMTPRLTKLFSTARVSSTGIHKRRDPEEIKTAEHIAANELQLYGYPIGLQASSPTLTPQ